ncbi:MAG: RluA family pseudouridine synthase [Oscillospiraceae bacterium]|jgi:23S rRNA pseudouridine1911/1915/1917 synthase|nr:RluA family pseudouridine synthase [Oscillospiraceae bacterium]
MACIKEEKPRESVAVPPGDTGLRLDVFLARETEFSRAALARLCAEGRVTLAGHPAGKNYRVSAGERFDLDIPPPVPAEAEPQDIPLTVVYEDGDLLILDKPRGLVVHPAAGHRDGTLVNALLYHRGDELSGVGGVARPGIVHRLDKDTSGLIAVAKNDFAHRGLAAQLADHEMARVYEALVEGRLRQSEGTVDRPVGRDPKNRKRMAVVSVGGKPAVTHYAALADLPGATHVECRLETGRTHQIRAHMRWLGHPLLGDKLYGGPDRWRLGGQCLHAKQLALTHPRTGERLTFTAERPPYFEELLARLNENG